MQINFIFNIMLYTLVVGLYIYEPVFGALGQIGLGIFQFVYGLTLIEGPKTSDYKAIKALKIYWLIVFTWFIIITITVITSFSNNHSFFFTVLYIIPMVIGLYFVFVTYLFNLKKLNYEN